jgi:hypothetical protein
MKDICLIATLGCSALLAQGAGGSIQGTVTDARTNKPVSGVLVIARAMPGSSTVQTAKTAVDGGFLLSDLPASTYSLCMKRVEDAYLDPCEWGQKATSVTLAQGQKSSGTRLALTTGSLVKIRIDDTDQLLFKKSKAGFLPDLSVGIFGPNGIFYPAHMVNRDIRGIDLQIAVPFNTPLSLSVNSRAATLVDSAGSTLAKGGASTSFQHATGDATSPSFTYRVKAAVP